MPTLVEYFNGTFWVRLSSCGTGGQGASIPQQPRRYSLDFPVPTPLSFLSSPFPPISPLPLPSPSLPSPSIPFCQEAAVTPETSSVPGIWREAPYDINFDAFWESENLFHTNYFIDFCISRDVTWRRQSRDHSIRHMPLPIGCPLETSLCLRLFSRYVTQQNEKKCWRTNERTDQPTKHDRSQYLLATMKPKDNTLWNRDTAVTHCNKEVFFYVTAVLGLARFLFSHRRYRLVAVQCHCRGACWQRRQPSV